MNKPNLGLIVKIVLPIVTRALVRIIDEASPFIRMELKNALKKMEAKARETRNPIDDYCVLVLKKIVGINE